MQPSQTSRLSYLPKDVLNEILSYGSLQDVKSFYESQNIKPTCEDLHQLAVRFRLPDAVSLRVLITLQKKTPQEMMKYCIEIDDPFYG